MTNTKIIIIAIIACTFFICVCVVGCKHLSKFEPIWLDELPNECQGHCNMFLNDLRAYYNSVDKSATRPSGASCYKCLDRLKCQKEVFGYNKENILNPVDYQDSIKYRNYTQCLSEIK